MFLKTQPPPKSLINKMIGLQGEHSICIIKPAEVESILFRIISQENIREEGKNIILPESQSM